MKEPLKGKVTRGTWWENLHRDRAEAQRVRLSHGPHPRLRAGGWAAVMTQGPQF